MGFNCFRARATSRSSLLFTTNTKIIRKKLLIKFVISEASKEFFWEIVDKA